jgi:hypothetical protein
MQRIIPYICILCLLSCSVKYSFSGASISPDVKTFSVSYITNQAQNKQATLSDVFTEGLKEKFRSNAGLSLVSKGGDLEFEGAIIDYSTAYQGITANQVAAQLRLTITVSVKFTNNIDPTKNFDKKYTWYQDFDAKLSLSSVETEYINQISKKIIDDIFMDAVANW